MTDRSPKIRLYVDAPLGAGAELELAAQAHYLTGVMRRGAGDEVALFNGRDGEWRAVIAAAAKKRVSLRVEAQTAPQQDPPDLWLLFAPIKKARTDFIVEKATELGAARIRPVLTRFTNAERVRTDRLQAHAVEAAEQCGGTYVPAVDAPAKLAEVLAAWPGGRRLMFCDEARTARPVAEALAGQARGPWAILIGPEGGFSPDEAAALRAHPGVLPVTLGPRVLRADTAAAAAITAWQVALGDWR
ncbi:16S rRNA (uracil(1498)-N(3))-methyltransferase [Rhodobacteraceae bacterium 2CG4]|uniref:Ribosomal RNA small subunit methyltransferase E n=1 Tax=Halovulum marinum TaxID=2662447 RepID=A0A6L5Z428_9RHOB|nr:16S rRNA (uracil(1498)-N(3))-methyltransferase [Halovulum marinum]MSU91313.1 16S rRNA (uracil(1498)-N(3))-methyltransferase [Halovulum marinum]